MQRKISLESLKLPDTTLIRKPELPTIKREDEYDIHK
jgi:hypothetical protein